ncbi:MAG: UDP-N-acetylglucosamine 2-epimerase (non-hydrolyzing) [Candidatus Cloacimonadaceae bacterium]
MKNLHLIVGARPNYMKIAPLYNEFTKYPELFKVKLIHTGQHYDTNMSKLFFEDLSMPKPDIFLKVGSGSHGVQTARVIEKYEGYVSQQKPDLVIVAGDVNSTLACALVAAKMCISVAHVEAGLRSFDRKMPEEINRLLTDQIADYLFTPSPDADENLSREGISKDKIYYVGNIMIDSLIRHRDIANCSDILNTLKLYQNRITRYCLVTLHRPSNVDSLEGFTTILEALQTIGEDITIVFPMHPRTRKNVSAFHLETVLNSIPNLISTEPLGYLDFLKLEMNADFVISDSGGIQEETTFLQIPCLTLRDNTERPITITEGTNQLVALDTQKIVNAVQSILAGNRKIGSIPQFWDGHTSERIVDILLKT